MRHVDRSKVKRPEILDSYESNSFREAVNKYLHSEAFERPPYPPEKILHSGEVSGVLYELFDGTCAYCEEPVERHNQGVEHFRPISGAERVNGDVDPKHYIWLALEWENLYLACPSCVRAKRNLFPVRVAGPVGANISVLRNAEGAYIVDPCADHPEDHFFIDAHGKFHPRSERGKVSIEVLDLNRPRLLQERRRVVDTFMFMWRRVLASESGPDTGDLLLFNPSSPYSGSANLLLQQVCRRHSITCPSALDLHDLTLVIKEVGEIEEATFQDRAEYDMSPGYEEFDRSRLTFRPIRHVKVLNFLAIHHLELDLPEPKGKSGGLMAILGENAVGKTCLLKAIALCLIGPRNAQRVVGDARHCVRRGSNSGEVIIDFWDVDEPSRLYFRSDNPKFNGNRKIKTPVLGYGAYRLPAKRKLGESKRRYQFRVHTLFDDRGLVNGPLGMLGKLEGDKKKVRNAAGTIKALLSSNDAEVDLINNSNIVVRADGATHLLSELSSGFKSIISLATDIMDVMYMVWNGVESGQAVVLIDELDAHLHPAWRIKIVKALKRAFPMAQFIFSTHDPLTLRGVEASEVVVLHRDQDGVPARMPYVPPIEGLLVDQILTSSVFGLNSTLSDEEDSLFSAYYDLLGKRDLSDEEKQNISAYQHLLEGKQVLGRTRRERLMYEIIDREIAVHASDPSFNEWNPHTIKQLFELIKDNEIIND